MNIEQAKKQVKYAVVSYLSKDEFGDYCIPVERQRPIFLMGPPGIGKTDIMRQIAEEMDIALVSYSMSHHTRQSALGLPFIASKNYDSKEYRTTEYTMSEIIASVYDVMEETSKKEGILFLDEINCVSETLAPSMLQFLQYKVFGRHRVPAGWVIVTAGNPPEYNNSVRDFDLATLDRLKKIDVEPDFSAWWSYAQNEDVHTAVLTYLEIKKDDFYSVQTTVDGKEFVTARSWVDLSDMMKLYEQNQLPINQELIRQYVQDERVARDFSAYYDLFYRYRETYQIHQILNGEVDSKVLDRAKESPFDERITVIHLLFDALAGDFAETNQQGESLNKLMLLIKEHNKELAESADKDTLEILDGLYEKLQENLQEKKSSNSISGKEMKTYKRVLQMIRTLGDRITENIPEDASSKKSSVQIIKSFIQEKQTLRKEAAARTGLRLENAFDYMQSAYEENELLVFVTTLTENKESAQYIANYGSESYYKYNKLLMLDQRENDLLSRIQQMED